MTRTTTGRLTALFLASLLAASAHAGGFNDRSIKGTWSLFVQGHTVAGNAFGVPGGTPLTAVATIHFDGRGNCSSRDQIVLGAQPAGSPEGAHEEARGALYIPSRNGFRDTEDGGACVYEVNRDGTGFFDVVFPDAPVTHTTFVISDRKQMRFIANNPDLGIFGGGEMRRQR